MCSMFCHLALAQLVLYSRKVYVMLLKCYKIVMYIDDGIGGAKSLDQATMVSEKIQTDLNSLGFLVAEDKC